MNIPDGGEYMNQPIGQNSGGAPSPFEDIKPRMPPSTCFDISDRSYSDGDCGVIMVIVVVIVLLVMVVMYW